MVRIVPVKCDRLASAMQQPVAGEERLVCRLVPTEVCQRERQFLLANEPGIR